MKSTLGFLGLALGLAVATLACASTSPAPAPSSTSSPAPAPAADASSDADPLVACTVDTDCTIIEVGCCDHCNGGAMMSVANAHVDAARDRWQDHECTNTACTERGCDWHEAPVCDNGTCARVEDRYDAAGSSPQRVVVQNGAVE